MSKIKPHGGKRDGAGRKRKWSTTRTQELIRDAAGKGILPLEYMLKTLRDESMSHADRFSAAKEAAPYIHPRLQAVEVSGDQDNPIRHEHEIFDLINGTSRGLAGAVDREGEDDPRGSKLATQ